MQHLLSESHRGDVDDTNTYQACDDGCNNSIESVACDLGDGRDSDILVASNRGGDPKLVLQLWKSKHRSNGLHTLCVFIPM